MSLTTLVLEKVPAKKTLTRRSKVLPVGKNKLSAVKGLQVDTHALVNQALTTAEFASKLSALGSTGVVTLDHVTPEATAFAIRIDVAEELTRLASHLDEISRLVKKGGDIGKRLDFLIDVF